MDYATQSEPPPVLQTRGVKVITTKHEERLNELVVQKNPQHSLGEAVHFRVAFVLTPAIPVQTRRQSSQQKSNKLQNLAQFETGGAHSTNLLGSIGNCKVL